jgi:hypothetical protein
MAPKSPALEIAGERGPAATDAGGAGGGAVSGYQALSGPAKMEGVPNNSASVGDASAKNEEIKVVSAEKIGNTMVNAPTNNVINNTNSNTPSRSPVRNQESTMSKYIENRYA